jgi:hypothetical protein
MAAIGWRRPQRLLSRRGLPIAITTTITLMCRIEIFR